MRFRIDQSVQISPRGRELGERIAECIREYRARHPSIDDLDVHRALNLAFTQTGGAKKMNAVQTIALLVAIGVSLAVFYFVFFMPN